MCVLGDRGAFGFLRLFAGLKKKKKKTPVNFNSRSGDDYSLLSDGTTGAGVSGAEVLAG